MRVLCCPLEIKRITRRNMHNGTLLAAVDLGSNSFRLEIGRFEHGHIQRMEYLKETVRLGNGLDEEFNLTREAMQRGWDCLARFGERLAGFERAQVRAVATQTLREARNREEFLARGGEILGYPIDVVSGPEEARLIYQGVARLLPQSDERRLVVDIGGRSTEFILGQQFRPHTVASFRVGSVAWSPGVWPTGLPVPLERWATSSRLRAALRGSSRRRASTGSRTACCAHTRRTACDWRGSRKTGGP